LSGIGLQDGNGLWEVADKAPRSAPHLEVDCLPELLQYDGHDPKPPHPYLS